jgi:hypothetical protein
VSCKEKPLDTALSPDEDYLVESYVRVRRAAALFSYQRVLADSLSTGRRRRPVRVARTIAALNTNPELRTVIYTTIEAHGKFERALGIHLSDPAHLLTSARVRTPSTE